MPYDPPTEPVELPADIVDTLEEYPPEQLRRVAHYAEALAEYREREDRLERDSDRGGLEDPSDDRPDEVPSKASITVKEINDNRYYYWQWREGDDIKSKYKGPVDPSD